MAALEVRPPFAVAVSGGSDSLALMRLCASWCVAKKIAPPQIVTVDHGLRRASAAEARQVADWAAKCGLPHTTLRWEGGKPSANLQAEARIARYALIGGWMRAEGIETLIVGHTLDDQAETFLLRLARGSGLDGLAGMAPLARFPLREFPGLRLGRPLLFFGRGALQSTLRRARQQWIEDPSNEDTRFARPRARTALDTLAAIGLNADRIASAAQNLRRARQAIDAAVSSLASRSLEVMPWGCALLDPAPLRDAPVEVALRLVSRLVESVGGASYPPRFGHTQDLLEWISSQRAGPRGRTLGFCRVARRPDGRIFFAREEAQLQASGPVVRISPGETVLWDGRFLVTLGSGAQGKALEIRALGSSGLRLAGKDAVLPPVEPRRVAACLPALWEARRLVAAPLLLPPPAEAPVSARFLGFER